MQKLVGLICLVLIPSLSCAASYKRVQVSVSPSGTTVVSGGTQQFSANISGTSNTSVTWSASAGTITATGVFTAPAVTQNTIVYVTASTTGYRSRSGTATVTITAPTTAPAPTPTPTPTQHIVDLSWNLSTSPNTSGYNVYRGTTSAGPYSKINSGGLVASSLYTDSNVSSGHTYYYVVTAVDSSGAESGYSNQTQAVVP
jgi:predicted phage tail protein